MDFCNSFPDLPPSGLLEAERRPADVHPTLAFRSLGASRATSGLNRQADSICFY